MSLANESIMKCKEKVLTFFSEQALTYKLLISGKGPSFVCCIFDYAVLFLTHPRNTLCTDTCKRWYSMHSPDATDLITFLHQNFI